MTPTLTPPPPAPARREQARTVDDLLVLVNELLDDHAKLYNYTFPCGFKRPRLNDEDYSLDLRQRVILAVQAAEKAEYPYPPKQKGEGK